MAAMAGWVLICQVGRCTLAARVSNRPQPTPTSVEHSAAAQKDNLVYKTHLTSDLIICSVVFSATKPIPSNMQHLKVRAG